MKTKILFFLLLCISLVSCYEDEDPVVPNPVTDIDIESPAISISTPTEGTAFTVLDRIAVSAIVTDDIGIRKVLVYLTSDALPNEYIPHSMMQYPTAAKREMYAESVRLPVNVQPGNYLLQLEARDKKNNVTTHSVAITLQSPDLDVAAFTKAFMTIGLFSSMDWLGYTFPNEKGMDERGISFAFGLMADGDWDYVISESEWVQFTSDFNLQSMKFEDWDEDANRSMSSTEFNNAIDSLNLLQAWDLDKDGFLGETEMSKGIFSRWDQNKNELLSREEYHHQFRTQFHFGW